MAKQSGLGQRLLVGGYDISGDIQALDNVHSALAPLDVTDITESAHERIAGLLDGGLGATAFFDSADAHPVLSALPTGDLAVSYLMGTTLANPAACLVAKQIGYDPTRGTDGSLTLKSEFQANGFGLEWGLQFTAGLATATAGESGTAADNGASSSGGGQMYVQLTAFTGTDITFGVETSSDDVTFAGLSGLEQMFTAAPGAGRTATGPLTVDRYARFYCYTSGGFTSATFSIVFVRNP